MRYETGFGEAEHLCDSPGLPFCKCLGFHQRLASPYSSRVIELSVMVRSYSVIKAAAVFGF
jgi:hypothetical protein